MSYDEFDRGYSFLFTLPVSKRGYVKEKYVLGLLFCGGIWLLSVLGSLVYVCINGEIPIDVSLFLSYAMPFVLVLILLGVALPVQLKCGNEKGRLAVVAVGLGAFLLIAGFGQLIKWLHIDVTAVLEKVSEIGVGTLGVIGLVVLVVFMGISYQVSVHVMEKKEF
ncbi:MAG: ABC-2 transporter permease [Mediterraneibacter gnavus]